MLIASSGFNVFSEGVKAENPTKRKQKMNTKKKNKANKSIENMSVMHFFIIKVVHRAHFVFQICV